MHNQCQVSQHKHRALTEQPPYASPTSSVVLLYSVCYHVIHSILAGTLWLVAIGLRQAWGPLHQGHAQFCQQWRLVSEQQPVLQQSWQAYTEGCYNIKLRVKQMRSKQPVQQLDQFLLQKNLQALDVLILQSALYLAWAVQPVQCGQCSSSDSLQYTVTPVVLAQLICFALVTVSVS